MKKLKGYGDPRFYKLLQRIAKLHSRKNQDYAKGGRFGHMGNFCRVSAFAKLYPGFDWSSPFGIAILYMLKQLDAAMILAQTQRNSITGEPVPARLKDVTTYSIITSILWEDLNGPKHNRPASKKKTRKTLSALRKRHAA